MRVSSFGRYAGSVPRREGVSLGSPQYMLVALGWERAGGGRGDGCRIGELMILMLTVIQYHNESVLKKYAPKLKIGTVKEEAKL
jgi:hypothetical protein